MEDIKEKYLASKQNSWSESTLKSERARLAAIPLSMLPRPDQLLAYLRDRGYSPYAIKTTFIRASQLSQFIGGKDAHLIANFMREHAREFRGAYQPKPVNTTFLEAVDAICGMEPRYRAVALGLLYTGLRMCEFNKVSLDGTVCGKGGKFRHVINFERVARLPASELPHFRVALKKATGLTPHQLRKIAATRAVELGAREAELLSMFGWSSMQTAAIYVQARNVSQIASKF